MRALVLGGTGTIGRAVVRALLDRGAAVDALARTDAAAAAVRGAGARPVTGDIGHPAGWREAVARADAVVHAACGFDDDMARTDAILLDGLLPAMAASGRTPALVYTGGCWLYGATGARIADEDAPLDPPPEWAWMVDHAARARAAPGVRAVVIHPAMVWDADGGVLRSMGADARAGRAVRVVADPGVRWPLVHADDLADLYVRAIERAPAGAIYNGAAIEGIAVGDLARAIAARAGAGGAIEVVPLDRWIAERGGWARGHGLDQQMSGRRARDALGWAPVRLDPAAVGDQKSRSA